MSASQMVATPDDALTLARQYPNTISTASLKLLNDLHTREREYNNGNSVSLIEVGSERERFTSHRTIGVERPRASFDAEGNRLPSSLWSRV